MHRYGAMEFGVLPYFGDLPFGPSERPIEFQLFPVLSLYFGFLWRYGDMPRSSGLSHACFRVIWSCYSGWTDWVCLWIKCFAIIVLRLHSVGVEMERLRFVR